MLCTWKVGPAIVTLPAEGLVKVMPFPAVRLRTVWEVFAVPLVSRVRPEVAEITTFELAVFVIVTPVPASKLRAP